MIIVTTTIIIVIIIIEIRVLVISIIAIIIGERAKRARHSQVCSIENRGYIYYNILWYVQFCSYNP